MTPIEWIVTIVFTLFVMRGVIAFVVDDLKIGEGNKMKWACYIPARILLLPLIHWDRYQRKKGVKPDEWYWADLWLAERGHLVGDYF